MHGRAGDPEEPNEQPEKECNASSTFSFGLEERRTPCYCPEMENIQEKEIQFLRNRSLSLRFQLPTQIGAFHYSKTEAYGIVG